MTFLWLLEFSLLIFAAIFKYTLEMDDHIQTFEDVLSEDGTNEAVPTEQDLDDAPLKPSDSLPQQHRKLILPEVAVFLYFIASVIQDPVTQFWLYDHFSKQYNLGEGNETSFCGNGNQTNTSRAEIEEKVQSETNKYVMATSFIANFVAIFPTLFIGPITDKYGRKFVLYISLGGIFLNLLMNICIYQFNLQPVFVCISSLILGLSGNYGLFLAASFGMIADITSEGKRRGFRITTTEATLAVASSIGTTMAGVFVKEIGYIWPMVIAMGIIFLAILFVLFLLPETLVELHNRTFSCKELAKSFTFYVKDTPDKRRFRLIVYLTCFLTVVWSLNGESNINILYMLHEPFCWPKIQISVFSGVLTMLKWIITIIVLLIGKRWISEPVFAMIASLSASAGFLVKGLAVNDAMIYIAAGASLLQYLNGPMCRTLLSKAVSASEQGALFSGIGVLQMMVSAVSGVVMSLLYGKGIHIFTGLPYLVLSGLVFINIFLLIAAIIHQRRHPKIEEPPAEDNERLIA